MDFGALPPEVNSGRMYAGPGTATLLAAAAGWAALAAELHAAAGGYRAVLTCLTDESWVGPSSMSMMGTVASYLRWMTTAAVWLRMPRRCTAMPPVRQRRGASGIPAAGPHECGRHGACRVGACGVLGAARPAGPGKAGSVTGPRAFVRSGRRSCGGPWSCGHARCIVVPPAGPTRLQISPRRPRSTPTCCRAVTVRRHRDAPVPSRSCRRVP